MIEPPYKILNQAQDAKFNRDGSTTPQIRVTFMVGTHGPFAERFDKDGYTAAVADARLRPFATEILRAAGEL